VATSERSSSDSALVTSVIRWYDEYERPLPWRSSTPWGVLVSEFMLQQTPVDRVLPAWQVWVDRWPTPDRLAASSVADALRAWGRLGYPRRARWLHQSAVVITEKFDGKVPVEREALLALPGVGDYTAAAVMAFAYGRRSVVLDTNVRRVVARAVHGVGQPAPHITSAERDRAEALWPARDARSARWSAGVMELGALVCTARRPACDQCPIRRACAWKRAGQPAATESARRQKQYEGSDRQARGRIMAALREAHGALTASALEETWPDAEQRDRALAALVADGLVVPLSRRRYALPD
jgi:A/G-specific adenine glycosylase